jgi:hypothetical protein
MWWRRPSTVYKISPKAVVSRGDGVTDLICCVYPSLRDARRAVFMHEYSPRIAAFAYARPDEYGGLFERSPALKETCRALGIPYRKRAIGAWLAGD